MIICLAGKNEIEIEIAMYIKVTYPHMELKGIVNKSDNGINGYFRSYKCFFKF